MAAMSDGDYLVRSVALLLKHDVSFSGAPTTVPAEFLNRIAAGWATPEETFPLTAEQVDLIGRFLDQDPSPEVERLAEDFREYVARCLPRPIGWTPAQITRAWMQENTCAIEEAARVGLPVTAAQDG